jgi:hypothetical protein
MEQAAALPPPTLAPNSTISSQTVIICPTIADSSLFCSKHHSFEGIHMWGLTGP